MAGYSNTPLPKKLGIAEGFAVLVVNEPQHYRALVAPLPDDVTFVAKPDGRTNLVHLFTTKAAELARELTSYRKKLDPSAIIWVSWPKKAAKVPTDITEDVVREIALPMGFVDVKVCAVDDVWSGLKLVVRKELR